MLPCHAAETIPGLVFETVRERPLAAIWEDGPAFAAFRGTEWMQEPCRSCERREVDFGGCRCQAMALAGDARATDPVCVKSPLHGRAGGAGGGLRAPGTTRWSGDGSRAGREEAVERERSTTCDLVLDQQIALGYRSISSWKK